MKILIAYDGSSCSDAALAELARSGLPPQAEVEVASVHEHWPQPPSNESVFESSLQELGTLKVAQSACEKLQKIFPEWHLHPIADMGSPAQAILERALVYKPNLIIVGAHSHSAIGRFLLGSVSQKVLTEAACSVHVARKNEHQKNTPMRILIGVDGSLASDAAVDTVCQRTWKPGSEARLLFSTYPIPAVAGDQIILPMVEWIASTRDKMENTLTRLTRKLQAAGLKASCLMVEGQPKYTLVREAEKWQADCIFVGATGMNRVDRFLLGSVSSAVASRAPCSVEIVRR